MPEEAWRALLFLSIGRALPTSLRHGPDQCQPYALVGQANMRRVKIVAGPDKPYAHGAVDVKTGAVVLRHHDRYELVELCRRLEWQIIDGEKPRLPPRGNRAA